MRSINQRRNVREQNMTPGRRRSQELNQGLPRGWRSQFAEVVSYEPVVADPFKLYGIVSTWQDADIVEALIQNCFDQGCDRVYILDNASKDDTVNLALSKGAEIAGVYETQYYDDDYRGKLQNEFVKKVTEEERHRDHWWMHLDSDEFPIGPDGGTVRDFLGTLSKSVNVIGSNFLELYPQHSEEYKVGMHPAACMSKAVWRRGGPDRYGACGHWKHFLTRQRCGLWKMGMTRGNHTVGINVNKITSRPIEPFITLPTFHCPFRREEDTRHRLEMLCTTNRNYLDDHVTRDQGAIKRWNTLDMVYSQQWDKVEWSHTQIFGRDVTGVALYDWRTLCPGIKESSWTN